MMRFAPARRRPPRSARPLALGAAFALALHASSAAAQQAAPLPSAPAPAPAPAEPAPPAAVPVPEIAQRAEELAARLRGIEEALAPAAEIEQIEARLPELSDRVALRLEATDQILASGSQLHAVGHLASAWQTLRASFAAASDVLTERATRLEADIQELAQREEVWQRTRDEARASQAPAPVLARIQEASAGIRATRQKVEKRRAAILVLQDRVTRERSVCDDALGRLAQFRSDVVQNLLVRDSAPVWRIEVVRRNPGELAARILDASTSELTEVREYLGDRSAAFVLAGAVLAVLGVAFRSARTRARRWLEQEPALERTVQILERPYSAALVLTVLLTSWQMQSLPQLLLQILATVAAVPALRVLLRVIDPGFRFALYAAAAFFVADRVRDVLSPVPLLEQAVFLLEMMAAVALVLWLLRPARLRRLDAVEEPTFHLRVLAFVVRGLGALFGVAFVAGAFGYMQLARLLGDGALASIYLALLLFVGRSAADGLVTLLLRVRPLASLRMVRRRRATLERRIERGLGWIVVMLWAAGTLEGFELLQPALVAARRVLAADITPGRVAITLDDLAAFALTLWAAFLLSRFVRFVLSEDVYPRAQLSRGVPYAVSNLLHYTILFGGFVLALGSIGLDLNRFTVLAGAFGVGIGFGLQTIVNNFVSGLILLFERPIQVGDTVQIGELMGEVRRIGIRSSTVRTWEGAEVILPNANLISDAVTNWTLSDRMRRIDLAVGVAYGTEPERVLALLLEVARAMPELAQQPVPVALFTGFGESCLDFTVRVWTERFEEYPVIKSALAVAVHRALRDAGIGIPFPQRDLHLRSVTPELAGALRGEPSGGKG